MSDSRDPDLEPRIRKLIQDAIAPLQQKIATLETKVAQLERKAEEDRRRETMQAPPRRRV
jgi:hypothetical protein